ncbi:MAG: hypothetical protein HY547_03305 [Elusimicrobia bacterium]|nr:hypothetical protein [Elusimicrobiota bacterium]
MKRALDAIKEKFKNKKILLLALIFLCGAGATSVLVVSRNRAALNRASSAARNADYSKTFKRARTADDNDLESMPYELAARSGFKRAGGAMAGSVPYDPSSGDPSQYGDSGGSNPAELIGGRTGVASLGVGVGGYGAGASGAGNAQEGGSGAVGGGSGAFGLSRGSGSGSGAPGAASGNVGFNYEGEDLGSGEQINSGDSVNSGKQMKSSQSGMNNKIKAMQGTKGKMASASSGGSRGRAAISKGSSGSNALGDLQQRTNIAYQSGSFDNEEQAAGAQDTAWWGGRASEETTPSGGSAQGGSGNASVNMTADGLVSPSDMDSSGYANASLSSENEQDSAGWTLTWSPKLIRAKDHDTNPGVYDPACDKNSDCRTWASDQIKTLWQAWDVSAFIVSGNSGMLESMRREIEKMKDPWLSTDLSLFDSLLGAFTGYQCESFYSDIDVKLTNASTGEKIEISDCASSWGAPPPYAMAYCEGEIFGLNSMNTRHGFETSFPENFEETVLNSSKPGVLSDGVTAAASKIYFDKTKDSYLLDDNPYDPVVESFGSSDLAVKVEHAGYGIMKVTYGICTNCNQAHSTSMWPSVYVNLFRNFDGSSEDGDNYKRCLPASSPLSKHFIRCTQLANCEFRDKCGVDDINDLHKNSANFNSLMSENSKLSSEQVCDLYYGINAAGVDGGEGMVEHCLANDGEWPTAPPSDCDVE